MTTVINILAAIGYGAVRAGRALLGVLQWVFVFAMGVLLLAPLLIAKLCLAVRYGWERSSLFCGVVFAAMEAGAGILDGQLVGVVIEEIPEEDFDTLEPVMLPVLTTGVH